MQEVKIIASDLDGTILFNYAKELDQELLVEIERLLDLGYIFAPASGRQLESMKKLFYPVKDRISYVCENGACVFHKGKLIYKASFEEKLAREIFDAIVALPKTEILVSGENTSYVMPRTEGYAEYIEKQIGNNTVVISSYDDIPESIAKIAYFAPVEEKDKTQKILEEQFKHSDCQIMTSGNEWVDFAPKGVNKGQGLKYLGEALNVDLGQIMAFGDNENDRSMLELVGHPYLMDPCNPTMLDLKAKRCKKVLDVLKELN